jgi:hypothetical protein
MLQVTIHIQMAIDDGTERERIDWPWQEGPSSQLYKCDQTSVLLVLPDPTVYLTIAIDIERENAAQPRRDPPGCAPNM